MALNPWSAILFDRVFPGADQTGQFRRQVLSPNSKIAVALYHLLYDNHLRPSFAVEEIATIILLRSKTREATMPQILETYRQLPYVYRVLHQDLVVGKADIHNTFREFHHLPEALTATLDVALQAAFSDEPASAVEMTEVDGICGSDEQHWNAEVEVNIQQLAGLQATPVLQGGLVVSATGTWVLSAGEEDAVLGKWYLHEAMLRNPAPPSSQLGGLPEELTLDILKYALSVPTNVTIRAVAQPGIYPREVPQACKFFVQMDGHTRPNPVDELLGPLLVNERWNRLGKEAFYTTNVFEMLDTLHRQDPLRGLSLAARFFELLGKSSASDGTPRYGVTPLLHMRNIKVEHHGHVLPIESESALHDRFINAVLSMPKLKTLQLEHHPWDLHAFHASAGPVEQFFRNWPSILKLPFGASKPKIYLPNQQSSARNILQSLIDARWDDRDFYTWWMEHCPLEVVNLSVEQALLVWDS